jgi:predicted metal-binding transcription factor (methanogenesis marker protein 9)
MIYHVLYVQTFPYRSVLNTKYIDHGNYSKKKKRTSSSSSYILSNHNTATGSMRLCCSITTSTYWHSGLSTA